jgi:hypothetical protein
MEEKHEELQRRARELRAHPEFKRQVAKLTNDQLLAWIHDLEADSEGSNAEAWYFLELDEDQADLAGAQADRNLVVLTACLDELAERRLEQSR